VASRLRPELKAEAKASIMGLGLRSTFLPEGLGQNFALEASEA